MPPAKPFPQDVQWPLQPAGAFLSFDQGLLPARIYKATGHLELARPDPGRAPAGNVIRFTPPAVQAAGSSLLFGRVISSKQLGNGLELAQAVGSSQITTQLTFIHDGVLRYEVVDWGAANPAATAAGADSGSRKHFYVVAAKVTSLE